MHDDDDENKTNPKNMKFPLQHIFSSKPDADFKEVCSLTLKHA